MGIRNRCSGAGTIAGFVLADLPGRSICSFRPARNAREQRKGDQLREGTTRQRPLGTGKRLWQARNLVLALLVGLIGFSGIKPAAAASSYIDTDVLNLRTEPGVWASVVTQMYQGESISVIDGPTDEGWYQIEYAGNVGWAWGGYLAVNGSLGWDGAPPSTGGNSGGGTTASTIPATSGSISIARATRSLCMRATTRLPPTTLRSATTRPIRNSTPRRPALITSTARTLDARPGPIWGKAFIEYWMAFDGERSNGFHSWSMDANGNVIPGGDGLTGGCVALEPGAAAAVYDWAPIGTRVEIHW